MFYRMTRIHFDEGGFDDLVDWAETVRGQVEGISGLLFADLVRTGPGHGMIIAAYENEADFNAAQDTVREVLGAMRDHLSDDPHTHAGTKVMSFKGSHNS